ncbi:hypothetical protein ABIC45_003778 [Mucilaginibacter rubeus]
MIKFNIKFRFVCGVFATIEGGLELISCARLQLYKTEKNMSLRAQRGNRTEA